MKIVKTKILFNSLIWVWDNKIAMVTLKEDLMVVVLESKDLSNTFKAIFEMIWHCHCENTKEP